MAWSLAKFASTPTALTKKLAITVSGFNANNAPFNQQVTIGFDSPEDRPVLGDRVSVHAGAKVLGAVTVGDGARIGANAVVIKDVPPGATAVGVPARILAPKSER